ncbi:MAG: hypothetical protein KAJ03_05375 [Gammaproteobacteria bacterium]|nr:hypothetical protein [Gammaproteobacteria bacterium]
MSVVKLLDAVGATGAGTSFKVPRKTQMGDISVQYIISATATAALEVSNDNVNWFAINSETASAMTDAAGSFIWMRGNVTAWTSGTVTLIAAIP